MATSGKIYVVSQKAGDAALERLVRASNSIQALRHVVADTMTVTLATQDGLVRLIAAGVKVEDAKGEADHV